jgi:flagellar biosynthetic protein FliR
MRYRLIFALALSLLLRPFISFDLAADSDLIYVMFLIKESLIGFFIGFIGRAFLGIIDFAGNIISMQMGLSNAVLFNPLMNAQTPITSSFLMVAAVTLVFVSDFHHIILMHLVKSYELFPPTFSLLAFGSGDVVQSLIKLISYTLLFGVQLSLPFLIVGIVFQFLLGLMNRLIPNLQIFMIMLPFQILWGLFLLLTLVGLMLQHFMSAFSDFYQHFPLRLI